MLRLWKMWYLEACFWLILIQDLYTFTRNTRSAIRILALEQKYHTKRTTQTFLSTQRFAVQYEQSTGVRRLLFTITFIPHYRFLSVSERNVILVLAEKKKMVGIFYKANTMNQVELLIFPAGWRHHKNCGACCQQSFYCCVSEYRRLL